MGHAAHHEPLHSPITILAQRAHSLHALWSPPCPLLLFLDAKTLTLTLTLERKSPPSKMTQKANQFKGQQKRKTIPPNRHGRVPITRKGKRVVKPSKFSKELDADRELTKFINHCNEIKAATVACKEGGHLSIVKPPKEAARSMNTAEEADQVGIKRPFVFSAGN